MQPFKTPSSSNLTLDDVPESVDLVFTCGPCERPQISIQFGSVKLGRISGVDLPWLSAAIALRDSGDGSVSATFSFKDGFSVPDDPNAFSHVEGDAHDLHLEVDIEISVDVSRIAQNDDRDMQQLLRFAFLRHHEASPIGRVERLSGLKYDGTDLDWFYACLCRPGIELPVEAAVVDRKGKGRAINQDNMPDEVLHIDGLTPTL